MASSMSNLTAARTTLPRIPIPPRPTLTTERLLLRPLTEGDLEAYHALRVQPAFMAESSLGKSDASLAETQAALGDLSDPSSETFLFGIFVAATGELIGDGGIHTVRFSGTGWPELGYKLAPAHWGCGYATEAMRAVLGAWWGLEREEAAVKVHRDSLRSATSIASTATNSQAKEPGESKGEGEEEEAGLVRECVAAEIATYNYGSKNVLGKLGFEHFGTWEEPDTQLHRLGQPLELGHYVLAKPS
ncbi:acetyltransferase domain-containing protein [Xylaria venustula]|nr:acetyltransferase domain-containing protein [Xylaria venustula]